MAYSTKTLLAGCLLLSLTSLTSACGNHQPATAAPDKNPKTDSSASSFFPVANYLESEIRYVDSTPLAILKCVTVNNRTDSSFLTPAEFHRLATAVFVPEDLDSSRLQKDYTESSFGDKTTGYLTFTYSPKNRAQAVQKVDVVVQPGEIRDQVKSIYMEREEKLSDTLRINKMYWQAGKSFLVVSSLQLPGKSPEIRQLKVVWNNEGTEQ